MLYCIRMTIHASGPSVIEAPIQTPPSEGPEGMIAAMLRLGQMPLQEEADPVDAPEDRPL